MAEIYPELNIEIRSLMEKLRLILEGDSAGSDRDSIRRIIRQFQPLIGPAVMEAYRQQFRSRYRYLVGEWRGSRRARSTVNGHAVANEEVREYLRRR